MATHGSVLVEVVDEDREALVELAAIYILPLALKAVIRLQIPEIIAGAAPEAALSASQIASALHGRRPNAKNLERILRALASRGVFTESKDEQPRNGSAEMRFSLNSVSRLLVGRGDGPSLGSFVELNADEALLKPFQHLQEAVLHGDSPFRLAYNGMHLFEFMQHNPTKNQLYNRAMADHSGLYMRSILDSGYEGFQGAKTLVDVGGGSGTNIGMIVAKHPHIRGINFDLPHVLPAGRRLPGVEHVEGDMFEAVPKGDAIFMKSILHCWNDEQCLKLLKNCHNALPTEGGKLIIVEMLIPGTMNDQSTSARVARLYDLIMLAGTEDGKERTKDEFNKLLRAAGFSSLNIVLKLDFVCVMETFKSVNP